MEWIITGLDLFSLYLYIYFNISAFPYMCCASDSALYSQMKHLLASSLINELNKTLTMVIYICWRVTIMTFFTNNLPSTLEVIYRDAQLIRQIEPGQLYCQKRVPHGQPESRHGFCWLTELNMNSRPLILLKLYSSRFSSSTLILDMVLLLVCLQMEGYSQLVAARMRNWALYLVISINGLILIINIHYFLHWINGVLCSFTVVLL